MIAGERGGQARSKVALINGAGRGQGWPRRDCSRGRRKRGADRRTLRRGRAEREFAGNGRGRLDVGDASQWPAMEAGDNASWIDILINNAGSWNRASPCHLDSSVHRVIRVNQSSCRHQYVAPSIIARGAPIVNISSSPAGDPRAARMSVEVRNARPPKVAAPDWARTSPRNSIHLACLTPRCVNPVGQAHQYEPRLAAGRRQPKVALCAVPRCDDARTAR